MDETKRQEAKEMITGNIYTDYEMAGSDEFIEYYFNGYDGLEEYCDNCGVYEEVED